MSVTVVPYSYTDMTNFNIDSTYTINRAYTNSSSTTFTRMNIPAGLTGSIYFLFDTSAVPADVIITRITANFKARINSTVRVLNTGCQLYSGTTAKGTSTAFSTTTATQFSISDTGSWTRAELNDLRLYVTGTASVSGSVRRIDFFGADVTIEYATQEYNQVLTATAEMIRIANDPAYGYNQTNRYGPPDFDCSSLAAYCFHNAGFTSIPYTASSRTWPGYAEDAGFTNVASIVDLETGDGMMYGDILITVSRHHVAVYIGNDQLVEAVHDENGTKGGPTTIPGDQTGDEIRVRSFYDWTWEYVARWIDGLGQGWNGPYIGASLLILPIKNLRRDRKYIVIGTDIE